MEKWNDLPADSGAALQFGLDTLPRIIWLMILISGHFNVTGNTDSWWTALD